MPTEIERIVHQEVQAYLRGVATDMEKVAKTHPEITLLQFAALMRLAAADIDENWNIEKAIENL